MDKLVIEGGKRLFGTVQISGAKNAALLAASILGIADEAIQERLVTYRFKQTDSVDNIPKDE